MSRYQHLLVRTVRKRFVVVDVSNNYHIILAETMPCLVSVEEKSNIRLQRDRYKGCVSLWEALRCEIWIIDCSRIEGILIWRRVLMTTGYRRPCVMNHIIFCINLYGLHLMLVHCYGYYSTSHLYCLEPYVGPFLRRLPSMWLAVVR